MIDEKLFGKIIYMQNGERAQVIKGYENKKLGECYLVNDDYPEPAPESGFGLRIYTVEQMEDILNEQGKYELVAEQNQKFREQQERIKREAAEQKAQRENLYGFTDNKSPMQAAKILKCLMKEFVYWDYEKDGREFKKVNPQAMTRKDYIIKSIKTDSFFDIQTFKGKPTYMLIHPKKDDIPEIFADITKTEYECMGNLIDLQEKHGNLVWYSGFFDEDYEAGEYIGKDNFIYE